VLTEVPGPRSWLQYGYQKETVDAEGYSHEEADQKKSPRFLVPEGNDAEVEKKTYEIHAVIYIQGKLVGR